MHVHVWLMRIIQDCVQWNFKSNIWARVRSFVAMRACLGHMSGMSWLSCGEDHNEVENRSLL